MKTDNELIAEFMKDGTLKEDISFYASDWSMLMPVVEKIANLYADSNHDRGWSKAVNDLRMPILSTNRDYVYKASVQFIHWYNANKS